MAFFLYNAGGIHHILSKGLRMEIINRQTRTSVHFNLAYVIASPWSVDNAKAVQFQKSLLDNGLDFSQTNIGPASFVLVRRQPSHLQIKLDCPAAQLSGIQILSAPPAYDLDGFIRDANAATIAYQQTFGAEQYQIIRTSAKIHPLYSCSDHAFKYPWEDRLGQSPQDFQCLGKRPVAGGGLRLVMPPHAAGEQEPCSIEIRLESSLREQKKVFVETTFTWPKPRVLQKDQKFDPAEHLNIVEQYAANEVWAFLTQTKTV